MGRHHPQVTATHRPTQADLAHGYQRGIVHLQHLGAVRKHLGVDEVGLGLAGDRLAQPSRVPVGHEADPTARRGDRSGQREPRAGGRLGHHQRTGVGGETFAEFGEAGQGRRHLEVLPDTFAADGDLVVGHHGGVDAD